MDIQGAGPDAPITTNEHGGSQSHIPYRFDLIDGPALAEMAKVLSQGAEKYGVNNWRKIPEVETHLNHLIMHVYAYLAGDRTDDHLSHIMCRSMFAQAVDIANAAEVTPVIDVAAFENAQHWKFKEGRWQIVLPDDVAQDHWDIQPDHI
jgi:Domain of unknown function (DUF5664)